MIVGTVTNEISQPVIKVTSKFATEIGKNPHVRTTMEESLKLIKILLYFEWSHCTDILLFFIRKRTPINEVAIDITIFFYIVWDAVVQCFFSYFVVQIVRPANAIIHHNGSGPKKREKQHLKLVFFYRFHKASTNSRQIHHFHNNILLSDRFLNSFFQLSGHRLVRLAIMIIVFFNVFKISDFHSTVDWIGHCRNEDQKKKDRLTYNYSFQIPLGNLR